MLVGNNGEPETTPTSETPAGVLTDLSTVCGRGGHGYFSGTVVEI